MAVLLAVWALTPATLVVRLEVTGRIGEGRTLVGTAVPEGEFAVAVVHLVGFVFVFVHVGVGGTAFA